MIGHPATDGIDSICVVALSRRICLCRGGGVLVRLEMPGVWAECGRGGSDGRGGGTSGVEIMYIRLN